MPSQITTFNNFADQITNVQLPDGSLVKLELFFHGATERWVFNLSYDVTVINGMGLCCHPNILRQWKNILPFGMSVATRDQTDPFDINDFSTGRVALYILNADEVKQVESLIFGGPQI